MTYKYSQLKSIVVIILGIFLSSCDSNEHNVKKNIQKIKESNLSKIEDVPKLKEYPQINYESEKLNDPFKSVVSQQLIVNKKSQSTNVIKRPDHDRPREYLENYTLDSLVMVGTLEKKGVMWALIVDKNGVIHRVTEGNYLGQNSGKIVKIREKTIEINELIADAENGWTNRSATLRIKN
jgi:type IV pilus assembly protein PilP